MEWKKVEIDLYFSTPAKILEITRVTKIGNGRGARTLKEQWFSRARRVDENLALLLSPGIVTQHLGGLSLTVAVARKREIITVFVRKNLPHKRYVFGLAKQQNSCLADFLYAGEKVT
jgi:hypothetical protein